MIHYNNICIKNVVLHYVGNKKADEGIIISNSEFQSTEAIDQLLTSYFLKPFLELQEYSHFSHESDLKFNEVFGFISEIFDDPGNLYQQSVNIAKHLYEQSTHPKIKGGEFYTVYFKDCIVGGKTIDAVGLFKSENKDTFLKIFSTSEGLGIESEKGININKLDKGCLVYNIERENGYVVSVVDNTNKGFEAQYWINDFLQVKQREDEYHQTQNVLSLCKNFITKDLPNNFEVSKAEQALLLNRSVNFFKENDSFDMEEFTHEVISKPEIIESFNKYKNHYQKDRELEISDSFSISESAVKKQSRIYKSVIKLDKNFHIYVHGGSDLIEQGTDEKGKFYKVYYQKEE